MNDLVEILLVEDNPGDVRLVQEALKDARVYNNLHVVGDGQAALDFIRSNDHANPQHIRPGLVLLDLYLPKLTGLEVLKSLKNDPEYKSIPVVMMTSSLEEQDVAQAYDLQANCYITKPLDFNQLTIVIKSIEDFWLSLVHLPKS